jgi:type VI secretion system ImpC/EvpB family protein/type VI secretion system ImpB/VipA family protein
MAEREKGIMGGSMKFGVGEDESVPEEVEGPLLPLRILAITSLVPDADHNAGATAPETVLRVDPHNPDDIFTKLRPRASFEVASVLADGRPLRIELSPTSMKSFRPDGLFAEVKLLRSLLDGRAVLERVRLGELTPEQARGQLERLWEGSRLASEILGLASTAAAPQAQSAPAPKPASSEEAKIDSILDMVDMGDGGGSSGPSDGAPTAAAGLDRETQDKFSKIIAQVAASGRKGGGARPSDAVPRVEQAMGVQLGAILQHPAVRRLERSYRGLRFLIDRAQRIPGVIIDVLAVPAEGAAAAFAAAVKRATDVPYSFAVVDTDIDGSVRSFTELASIAETAEGYVVPALVNGTEGLLGVGDLASIERIDNKQGLFTAPHRAPWRAAVQKSPLRWVSVAMNGVLARGPYDKQSSRMREAIIKETPDDHEAVVWMSPVWAVATLIVQSFKDTGWPARIAGTKNGMIENLPVREIEDGGQTVAVPTQAYLSTDAQREMARLGVLLLASAPNSDAAYVHTAPTAYVQPDKKTYDSATTEPENRPPAVSLVDQLFIARLVQFARSLCEKIPPESDPTEVQEVLKAALWALFDKAPPAGPQISVKVAKSADGLVATIGVEPRRYLGVSLEEFGFEMPIG